MSERQYGYGRGKVYPASAARGLLNPARRLVQPRSSIARRTGARPADSLLELGCGPGYFSGHLGRLVPDGRLILFDLQPEMLLHARRHAGGAGTGLVAGDALDLPFARGAFDVVFISAVLGEIPDPVGALREIHRVLRSGGRLLVVEVRGDPDRIAPAALSSMVTDVGFAAESRRGRGWSYTATFVRES
ncbi:MAG: class I SAM-dependent methyltransferase [Acidimicrobiia bacterium]|nr:class I SAM-dependent methyltransferase [Acidimicrobiia bacterium]